MPSGCRLSSSACEASRLALRVECVRDGGDLPDLDGANDPCASHLIEETDVFGCRGLENDRDGAL